MFAYERQSRRHSCMKNIPMFLELCIDSFRIRLRERAMQCQAHTRHLERSTLTTLIEYSPSTLYNVLHPYLPILEAASMVQ